MIVTELITKLLDMPPTAKVVLSNCDGCHECNPYGYTQEHDMYNIEYKETKWYKRIQREVILS